MLYLPCCLLLAAYCCWPIAAQHTASNQQGPVVSTTSGHVRGSSKSYKDSPYDEFLGIPFAAPPVDELRFSKPDPVASWNDTRDASAFGPKCVQIIASGDEDCLYLNVVVPDGVEQYRSEPLPVMVYSYGGAFVIGSANQYPGHGLAVTGKVIVVTYNYRVNPIGFLSTGDHWSPGNYGLWDSRAAFMWVKDNIAAFGGDPARVTAIGQSAGGAISSHFVTSPVTQGLIQRVIAMSGSSSAFFGAASKTTKMTRNLAIATLCPVLSNERLVKCLRGKTAASIDFNGYVSSVMLGQHMPVWIPVVDGEFVPKKPQEAWKDGAGANIDFMIGSAHDDGAGLIYLNPFGLPDANFNLAADRLLLNTAMKALFRPLGDPDVLLKAVQDRYLDLLSEDVLARTKAASQALSDFGFGSAAHQEADFHAANTAASGHNTYLFSFRYRQSFMHYEPWVTGSHVDDVWSLLGEELFADIRTAIMGNFSSEDLLVSSNIVKYYANFAYTGNPNTGPHQVPTEWPQYDSVNKRYLEQSGTMTVKNMTEDVLSRYQFWTETWPTLIDPTYTTLDDPQETTDMQSMLRPVIQHVKDYVQRLLH